MEACRLREEVVAEGGVSHQRMQAEGEKYNDRRAARTLTPEEDIEGNCVDCATAFRRERAMERTVRGLTMAVN